MTTINEAAEHEKIPLGRLVLLAASHELGRGDRCVYLEPRQFQLLLTLYKANGLPVSRDILITQVWQGRIVSDGAINRAVSTLRKVFSELDPQHQYIETLPKLGYRLQLPVVDFSVPAAANNNQCTDSSHSTRPSRRYLPVVWFSLALLLVLLSVTLYLARSGSKQPPLSALVVSSQVVPLTSFDGAEMDISVDSRGTRLLYHRQHDGAKRQLWLHTFATGEHQSLTHADSDSAYASLSPDGSQIVFARMQKQQCQLILKHIDLQSLRELAPCSVDSAAKIIWHSDGSSVYVRQRLDKTKPYTVWQYNLHTGAARQLTLPAAGYSGDGDMALAISGQGTLVIARYLSPSRSRLIFIDSVTGERLDQFELDIAVRGLHWLQNQLLLNDERTVYRMSEQQLIPVYHAADALQSVAIAAGAIFFSSLQQRTDIWLQDNDGNVSTRITSSRLDLLPRADHNAKQLAFLSTRQGHHQLWWQDATGQEKLLTELPGVAGFARFSWAPDNQSLLLSKDNAVFRIGVPDGKVSTLIPAEKQVMVANWSADGQHIIYSSHRSGDWQLYLYEVQSATERQLTEHGGYSGYIWQNALYYSRYHQDGLWRKPLAGGEETLVLASFDKINWLNWQLDRGIIHFYKPNDGIYRYNLVSQQLQRQLTETPGFVRQFSVSAGKLFYVRRPAMQGDVYKLSITSQ